MLVAGCELSIPITCRVLVAHSVALSLGREHVAPYSNMSKQTSAIQQRLMLRASLPPSCSRTLGLSQDRME